MQETNGKVLPAQILGATLSPKRSCLLLGKFQQIDWCRSPSTCSIISYCYWFDFHQITWTCHARRLSNTQWLVRLPSNWTSNSIEKCFVLDMPWCSAGTQFYTEECKSPHKNTITVTEYHDISQQHLLPAKKANAISHCTPMQTQQSFTPFFSDCP